MTLLYLAGPMSGIEDFNFPAFNRVEAELRTAGFEVYNPASLGVLTGWDWEDYLKDALRNMLACEAVALLDGWLASRGAMLEAYVAAQLSMPIRAWRHWIAKDEI